MAKKWTRKSSRSYPIISEGDANLALDQFHHQEALRAILFESVDARNVGVLEGPEGPGFALKTRDTFGVGTHVLRKDLDRDLPIEIWVMGAVNLAHAASTEWRQIGIRTESCLRLHVLMTPLLYPTVTEALKQHQKGGIYAAPTELRVD